MSSSPLSGRRRVMATLKTSFQNLSPSSSRRNSVRPPSSPGSAANSAPSSPVLTQRQNPEATGNEWQGPPHPGEIVVIPPSRSPSPVTAPRITYAHDARVRTAQHFSLEGVSSALASRDLDEGASLQSSTDPVQSNESGRTDGPPSDDPFGDLMGLVSEFAPTLSGESWTKDDLKNALWECSAAHEDEKWRDEKWSKLRSVLNKVAETANNPEVVSAVHRIQDQMNPPRPILVPRPSVYPGSLSFQSPG